MVDSVTSHGWTAVPRDASILLTSVGNVGNIEPVKVNEVWLPDTEQARKVLEYARRELTEETFNHSMRVYYYGQAIRKQIFPDWCLSDETYLVTCLLHDIGTTERNISATLMSFEFYGGMLAHSFLEKDLQAPTPQAEAVTEAIIRHQDIGNSGNITTLGQLLQLATIFDNMGGHADMVHKDTIGDVVEHYPRKNWSSCFAATIRKENGLKPWAHTTALGERDFPEGVENNKLMEPYDA